MKPWEKYQQQADQQDVADQQEQGPWSSYQAQTMADRYAPENPVEVSGLPIADRTNADRFKSAFTQMALGIPDGVAQIGINTFGSPEMQREWQAKVDAERATLGEDMRTPAGFIGGMAGGVIGPGSMIGAASKIPRIGQALKASMIPTTAGRAAMVGGVAAGLQPVASDESRLVNVGLGTVGGLGGYGLGQGLGAVLNRMTGGRLAEVIEKKALANAAKENPSITVSEKGVPSITKELREELLAGSGIDFDSLPKEAKATVSEYVARSVAAGGKISPVEAARQALTESLPVSIPNLTRGQRTQNFVNQNTEDVLANTDAGAPIRTLREAQRQGLKNNFDQFAGAFGEGSSPEMMGGVIRADILKSRQAAAANVRELYKQAEGEAGGKIVKPNALVEFFQANEGLEGIGELMNRAKALKIISVDAEGNMIANSTPLARLNDLRRSATLVGGGSDPTKGYFAGQTKGVIDDIVDTNGGQAYGVATAARRQMGTDFDNNQGVGQITKKKGGRFGQDFAVADEKIIDKLATTGSINDLKNYLKQASPEAKSALSATLAGRLRDKAVGEINGQPTISLVALEREVARIGPEKLKLMLGGTTYGQLKHVMQAAQLIERKQQAIGGGSQTAYSLENLKAAGLNLLDRAVGAVPGGSIISGVVKVGAKQSANQKAVKEVLEPAKAQMQRELRSRPLGNVNALMTLMGGAALPSYDNNSQ